MLILNFLNHVDFFLRLRRHTPPLRHLLRRLRARDRAAFNRAARRPRHRKHLLFIHRPTCEDTLPRGRGLCHHRLHLRPRNRPAPLPPRHHRHRLRGILGACRLLLLRRPRQRVRRDTRQLRRDGLLHPRPPRAAAHRQPPCVLAAALLRRRSRAHRYTAGA